MFKLKVNIIYQCQYKVKVITLGQRSTLVFLNRILFLSGTFYHLLNDHQHEDYIVVCIDAQMYGYTQQVVFKMLTTFKTF